MDRLPNGDIVINFEELQTGVVAVDLSPSRICNSSLANRLRNAEYAMTAGIHSDDSAVVSDLVNSKGLKNDSVLDHLEQLGQRELLFDALTVIPQEEVVDFEDSIVSLTGISFQALVKYVVKNCGSKISKSIAEDFALLFQEGAIQLFNDLFPEDQNL